ncbi:hypothetical protein MBM_02817 [Drepanopeziza brunnea f. sp. 'multigermtubi' MB_m1]|uniref:Glycosyl transferase CAP10 domain-containing protein n=1 Tax=Marssonina brunnea f. sp. multigermtubi (strain MB_m1) TaxID=1072389 RepID=K1WPP3_MARBU|nr:uncharacterized protein MBM_02817 [Drepanopeziza brunnea f. sp. 'multigermtubi' MB_m1]EKD19580.1 hypothetical protein MBM_02817 [Drepanopeziza brunnea f. sp. 'multigermtubi' MB_m1]
MHDLRPFWGIEPANIRKLAAYMHKTSDGISGMHIRNKKVKEMTNANWRIEAFRKSIRPFVKFLPDIEISTNIHDQPRVVFSQGLSNLYDPKNQFSRDYRSEVFGASREPYMSIAQEACPPLSRARNQTVGFESDWRRDIHGFVTNFNRSSDLCVVGPDIQDKHGLLFASSTMTASRQLLPVFGECKTNINSDILFPANMYTMSDNRYVYDKTYDVDWADKNDTLMWRGVTSGVANTIDNWEQMHRSRLVLLTNATIQADKEVQILSGDPDLKSSYHTSNNFNASDFAAQHTDVSFTAGISCLPGCVFLGNFLSYKTVSELSKQFMSKYLIDVDGHSFSGRWYAFLKSKSLGIKSTIFREWHDSRLFAWRHFVPLDTSYEELYSILTYFIGIGSASSSLKEGALYVPRHEFAARRLGKQGRGWAGKVLRREDIEIYTFRLLLEYARVSDDNRHAIVYGGDGSEMDEVDERHPFP